MRYNGTLSEWNDERGFGFVTVAGTGARHFMHIRAFQAGGRRPVIGDRVTFELQAQENGRPPAAVAVRLAGEKAAARPAAPKDRRFAVDWTIALLQMLALGAALFSARLPGWVGLLIIIGSFIAFVMFNIDKRRAEQGMSRERISEASLLQVSLIGWPGALAAQQLFSHKSSKSRFYWPFRLIGLGQALVLGWFALGRNLPL